MSLVTLESRSRHTAYFMTRSSHLISPFEGQVVGGLGSMNSAGSRLISMNSLIRSTATYTIADDDHFKARHEHQHSIITIDCSSPTNRRTMKSNCVEHQLAASSTQTMRILTSPVTVDAKANAKPAVEAAIPGVSTATKAVAPTTALESKLNLADSQRLAMHNQSSFTPEVCGHAYLPTSNSTDWYS
jgi:hypothetical protein